MLFKPLTVVAAAAGVAMAQTRPTNESICDYYTTAALKNNTAANQMTLLTLLVNTAVIGNYSKDALPGKVVQGILNPNGTTTNGTKVNLLPYFDGGLASSNRGGSEGVAVNFLDDGGAVPLTLNMPANGTSSNQYKLLTHLYEYFGMLLNCSMQTNTSSFKQYAGDASQYSIHQYMDLKPSDVTYFIEQVGASAASFGVADEDVTAVGTALNTLFNYRCSAAVAIIPYQGSQEQSICIDESCPIAPMNAMCPAMAAMEPGVANSTLAMGLGNSSSSATSSAPVGGASGTSSPSASMSTSKSKAGAAMQTMGPVAAVMGAAAFALAL